MIKLKNIVKSLMEGLRIDPDGNLVDDVQNGDAIVSMGWKKTGRLKVKRGITVFPAFFIKKVSETQFVKFSAEQQNSIRRAVKHPNSEISKQTIDKYINTSLHSFRHYYDVSKIDTIIPLPSRSNINKQIAERIGSITPTAVVLSNILEKLKWKDVEINYDMLGGEKRGEESLEHLEAVLHHRRTNTPNEHIRMSQVPMSLRRYIKNFLKVSPEVKQQILDDHINGKTVLIVDDTMEEGATMESAYSTIVGLSPREIYVYVLLYTDSTNKSKEDPPHNYTEHIKANFRP